MRFKYETLTSLFQKTDAFNEAGLSLFKKVKDAAWQKFDGQNNTANEETLIKRFENMLQEIEVSLRTAEVQ